MSLSSLLTFVFIIAGLFVSFQIDLPSGPTIVIISVLFYLLGILLTRCLLRPKT
jgi:ABC-type Mn2+/Zn2+ transport system permease subunit